MDISIVIVSWNARKFLTECLETVLREAEGLKAEIIVVDNASSDGSPEVVKERFPGVKLIQTGANYGFARANNIGITESSGKYVLLVNSDIHVLDGCFHRIHRYMEEDRSIGLLGPLVFNPDMTLQKTCRRFPKLSRSLLTAIGLDAFLESLSFFPHDRTRRVEVLSGCFMAARRKAIEKTGGLDERFFMYAEDKDWCKRFHEAGWKIVFYPEARVIHYGGSSSANAPVRFYMEMQKANLQYWKKHHGVLSLAAYICVTLFHQTLRIGKAFMSYLLRPSRRDDSVYKLKRSYTCIKWLISGRASLTNA